MRHDTRTNPSSARRRDRDVDSKESQKDDPLANTTFYMPSNSTQMRRDE